MDDLLAQARIRMEEACRMAAVWRAAHRGRHPWFLARLVSRPARLSRERCWSERRTRPKSAGQVVPPRRRPSSLSLSEEVREQLDAFLTTVSDRDPALAAFTDLTTASLEALLIEQELRAMSEARKRSTFTRSY